MAICRREAPKRGLDLEEYVWDVVEALLLRASCGDVDAAKVVLDRLCGVLAQPDVQVSFNQQNNNVHLGPEIPETRELGQYMRDLHDVAEELLVVDVQPVDEVDDLLS